MKKYVVTIEQTDYYLVTVEAADKNKAKEKALEEIKEVSYIPQECSPYSVYDIEEKQS